VPRPAAGDVYRAIGDPTRREILNVLLAGPTGFQDLHARFPLTKGAVSQHLTVLVEAGLVEIDPGDRARRYRLTPAPLHEVDQWLAAYREFWTDRLDALAEAVRARAARRPANRAASPDDLPNAQEDS